jgi:hypothetical protein
LIDITPRVTLDKYNLFPARYAKREKFFFDPTITMSASSSSSSTFEWALERFQDLRLATAIVESPRTLLATLFGVPTSKLPADIPDVATYDAVFDTAQQCVVPIKKALIAAAGDAIQFVVERAEVTQRLSELALYDAQHAVLHLTTELL